MTSEKALAELDRILKDISINPRSNKRAKAINHKLSNEYFTAERCISFVALYKVVC